MSGTIYGNPQSSPYYNDAVAAAQQYGVPVNLFLNQISVESGWNPTAINPSSGATGIAQFLPSTASNAGYGISPFDPTNPSASLNAAAQYDSALYAQTGSWGQALAAYAQGLGNVQNGNAYNNLSPQYQQLVQQAQQYDAQGNPANGSNYYSGNYPGNGYGGVIANANGGSNTGSSGTGILSGFQGWLAQSAGNVVIVILGVVFVAGGLFLLGGGKPSQLIAAAI
jgi:hypothetical protein